METDVLVVGAGASGIPAAIGAARAGARVLLIEEDPVVGGAPVDAYVSSFCGTPITGVVKEIDDTLRGAHGLGGITRFSLPVAWQRCFAELLSRERRLDVLLGARAVDVLPAAKEGRAVGGVRVGADTAPPLAIRAKVTIDATGSGAVAVKAGCTAMYGREAKDDFGEDHARAARDNVVQDCTWMYFSQQLGGGPCFDMMRLSAAAGVLVDGVGWFHNAPDKAMAANPRLFLHWGCAVKCEDVRDPIAVARAQDEALRAMERDHAMLREAGYAVYLAPRLGVRESNRILGEHVVSECDLMSGEFPDDTVAVGMYELDIWGGDDDGGIVHGRMPPYGIPYRAMVPKGVDGLLLAGKAISGTHVAMSAYRVMPIVGAAGQAAGVAGALCVQQAKQPRDIDPADIRRILTGDSQRLQLEYH